MSVEVVDSFAGWCSCRMSCGPDLLYKDKYRVLLYVLATFDPAASTSNYADMLNEVTKSTCEGQGKGPCDLLLSMIVPGSGRWSLGRCRDGGERVSWSLPLVTFRALSG